MSKRRKIETSLIKLPKIYNNFSLTINSDNFVDHDHSAINFRYQIEGLVSTYFMNGALNLQAGDSWEVSLERLIMPNNLITFPSISQEGNLNSAYIVIGISFSYKQNQGKSEFKKLEIPYFFKHKKYSVPDLLSELYEGIESVFSYLCSADKYGINLPYFFFISSCFHCYINPINKYVTFKSLNIYSEEKINPFYKFFNEFFCSEKFTGNKMKINLNEINLFASNFILDKLGKFDLSSLKNSEAHSNVFKNIKLDQLIFTHKNLSTQSNKMIASTIPYKENNLSILYFKTDIINHIDQNSNFAPLAAIPIPVLRENPIIFEPIHPVYIPIKKMQIREINFLLTDELNTKLNLTNGNLNFTLGFRTNHI